MKRTMRTSAYLGTGVVMAALWMATTVACGSSDEEDPATADKEQERESARNYYVQRVHTQLASCVACHAGSTGPKFMAQDATDSYTTIERTAGLISAPKNSPLVQYVHKDPAIVVSPEQRSIVTQWLGLEANARGLEGAIEKPKTITEAYKQFADCMNFDVWTFFRMSDLPFAQTDTEGPCFGCHSTGQGSAWLSAGSRETFEKARQFPFIQKFVVGKLDARGSFESLQPSNRLIEKANEICPPESKSCHPRFGLPPELSDAVTQFVDTTLERLATGTCSSGIVVPQVEAGADSGDGGDGGPK